MLRLIALRTRRGLSLRVRYTYAHAMDWNPNESAQVTGPSVLDPTDFRAGVRNQQSRCAPLRLHLPSSGSPAGSCATGPGDLGNGWMLSGIGYFHSGLPYSMRTAGSLAKEFTSSGAAIVALGAGHEWLRRRQAASTAWAATPSAIRPRGRPICAWASTSTWAASRQLELLAESFNLFNHRNVDRA